MQADLLALKQHSESSMADCQSAPVEALVREREVALRVEALSKRGTGVMKALAGLSFDVRQGEVFGLLGSNGAGKTTLISTLATEQRPSAGDALILRARYPRQAPFVTWSA